MNKLFKSVRVDTIVLVSTVMRSQFMSKVFTRFNFIKHNHFEYIYKHSNFTIKFNPIDKYGRPLQTKIMRQHWTLKIELQYEALRTMNADINYLLQEFDFTIKQLELAFDFISPFSQHFSYIGKAKANYKFKKSGGEIVDCGENYYIYSDSSRQQSLIYNKKKQLKDVKGIEIDDKHLLRYEITIRPKKDEQKPIHELEFGWIEKYLEKFIFIPNMKKIPKLDNNTYKLMQKIMRRRGKDFKRIPERQGDKIKEIAKRNKFDFVSAFNNNIEQLFSWIPEKLSDEEMFKLFG